MKSVDELSLNYRATALARYHEAFKNAPKEAIEQHLCDILQARLQKSLPDSNIYIYIGSGRIYLYGKDNIGKSMALALEAHEDILRLFGGAFKDSEWDGGDTMEYRWEKFILYVCVAGSTTCRHVKIGTNSRTIKEDIYEIVCD